MIVAGFVLGVVGVFGWVIPLIGFPVTITGLILSIRGRSKAQGSKGLATAGIVLNVIFLVVTIVNSAIGVYMGYNGQLF